MVGTDIVPVSRGQSALDLMSTLIDAAESILWKAGEVSRDPHSVGGSFVPQFHVKCVLF